MAYREFKTMENPIGQSKLLFDGLVFKFLWRENGKGDGNERSITCPLNLFDREADGKRLTVRIENHTACPVFSGKSRYAGKKIFILETICMLIIAYSNLYSFDGERNGFILGGGIGAGYQINRNWTSGITNTVNNRVVFLTNFKMGYAPSNTPEFFYLSKVSWWGESDIACAADLTHG